MEPSVILIAGPTCSGKSRVALELARRFNGAIISADSRQVYRRMDIGTAKPGIDELAEIQHFCMDNREPGEDYSAAHFEAEALGAIESIIANGQLPIVAGGSGLYLRALTDGIEAKAGNDPVYREYLFRIREQDGNDGLYRLLKEKDPAAAASMMPQNYKRVMRALEVQHLTGSSILSFFGLGTNQRPFHFIQYCLCPDRKVLYSLIEARVDEMIEKGLVAEVRGILEAGYSRQLNALNTVGYKEIIGFLDGLFSLERAIDLIKRNTRRYAKRQFTWFNADDRFNFLRNESQLPHSVWLGEVVTKISESLKEGT